MIRAAALAVSGFILGVQFRKTDLGFANDTLDQIIPAVTVGFVLKNLTRLKIG